MTDSNNDTRRLVRFPDQILFVSDIEMEDAGDFRDVFSDDAILKKLRAYFQAGKP